MTELNIWYERIYPNGGLPCAAKGVEIAHAWLGARWIWTGRAADAETVRRHLEQFEPPRLDAHLADVRGSGAGPIFLWRVSKILDDASYCADGSCLVRRDGWPACLTPRVAEAEPEPDPIDTVIADAAIALIDLMKTDASTRAEIVRRLTGATDD